MGTLHSTEEEELRSPVCVLLMQAASKSETGKHWPNKKHCDELVDFFSLGALLHLCICGQQLFPGQFVRDILKSNHKSKFDLNLHASKRLDAADLEFLGRLLAKAPSERPSARDALEQQWLHEWHEDQVVKTVHMGETQEGNSTNNDFVL